jgi:uncharacterized protein (TIGR03435 family)
MIRIAAIAGGWILASLAVAQPSARPSFEVASIRPSQTPPGRGLPSLREDINTGPGSLSMRNVTLPTCIRWAYKLNVYEIKAPDALSAARYDITAKAEAAAAEEQLRLMLQTLLAERFQLVFHRQNMDVPGYVIVAGKNGAKLTAVEGGGEGGMTGAALVFEGHRMPLSRLADIVSSTLKSPVLDRTDLPGYYDFKLDLRPYLTSRQPGDPPLDLVDVAMSALEDELGLKLVQRKLQLDVLVVDRAAKTPSGN